MTTDQDLAALVRNSIPDSELHSVDPDAIKTAASRRRARRRTVILAGLAVAAVSITRAILLSSPTPAPQTADDSPAAAKGSPVPPRSHPGCPPPLIRITGAPMTGFLTVSTRVGAEVTIPAVVPNNPASTLVDGALVVGAPGTTMGRYVTDPAARPFPPLPATDITRAENQVGRQTLRQGEPAIVRFTATAPGDYPVFYLFTYQGQGNCTRGQTRPPVSGLGQVATIHVS